MTITGNRAAWQTAAEKRPLEVGPAPNPDPAENEVVIRVAYAAVNSCDWNVRTLIPFLKYILSSFCPDAIKPVLGDGISCYMGNRCFRNHRTARCKYHQIQGWPKSNRVGFSQQTSAKWKKLIQFSQCDSLVTRKVPNAGFQLYSTCLENFVAAIPDSLPLANAGVLPLAISTSASALFFDHKLPFPTLKPKSTGKTLLVWGGSSSIGCSAIQLAIAAGCNVVATASKANFELVTSLGATKVFDYKDPNVVDEILKNLKPDDFIFNCIGTKETQSVCAEILGKLGGGKIPTLNPPQVPVPENVVPNFGMWESSLMNFYFNLY